VPPAAAAWAPPGCGVRGARAPRGAPGLGRRPVCARPARGARRRRGGQGAPEGRGGRRQGAEPVRLHQVPRQAGGHGAHRRGDPHRRERRLQPRPLPRRLARSVSLALNPCGGNALFLFWFWSVRGLFTFSFRVSVAVSLSAVKQYYFACSIALIWGMRMVFSLIWRLSS
jgi:hypothetical protein